MYQVAVLAKAAHRPTLKVSLPCSNRTNPLQPFAVTPQADAPPNPASALLSLRSLIPKIHVRLHAQFIPYYATTISLYKPTLSLPEIHVYILPTPPSFPFAPPPPCKPRRQIPTKIDRNILPHTITNPAYASKMRKSKSKNQKIGQSLAKRLVFKKQGARLTDYFCS